MKDVRKINAAYNHNYLYAEYNHALGASQMAAKWHDFEQDGDEYHLQYRTAGDDHVREEHALLHNTTLPPSDPFWDKYFPPNGWNCRCTTVQVIADEHPVSDSDLAMQRGDNCTDGAKRAIFRYNPGKTMDVFPPKHPYLPKGCGNCSKNLQLAYDPKREKCRACVAINEQKRREVNKRMYDRLSKDSKYTNVIYDPASGGLRAAHRGHNTDIGGSERFFNGTMKASDLELKLQELLFRSGHSVVFCDEQKKGKNGNILPALDMELDGTVMDIKTITVRKNHYGAALKNKNKQLWKYNHRSDVKIKSDTICLYFHEERMYSKGRIIKSITWLKNKSKNLCVKHVVCVINKNRGIEIKSFDI